MIKEYGRKHISKENILAITNLEKDVGLRLSSIVRNNTESNFILNAASKLNKKQKKNYPSSLEEQMEKDQERIKRYNNYSEIFLVGTVLISIEALAFSLSMPVFSGVLIASLGPFFASCILNASTAMQKISAGRVLFDYHHLLRRMDFQEI